MQKILGRRHVDLELKGNLADGAKKRWMDAADATIFSSS
jgi:hypothetical protein